MEWIPTPNDETEQVAVPEDTVCEAQVPMVTPLSLKATVPVGVPPVSVAVYVREDPNADEFVPDDNVRMVVVAAAFTVMPD